MKTTHRTLVLSIVPLFTTMIAVGESEAVSDSKSTTAMKEDASPGMASGWRVSKVIGTDVKTASNEKIGDIKDLVVDFKTGKISAVVISSGGFLGIADNLTSLAPADLRYDMSSKTFIIDMSKEQLAQAPRYKSSGTWGQGDAIPSSNTSNSSETRTGNVAAADNTARNARDMEEKKLTPLDQGNSDGDLAITKNIRSAVMSTDLSFNAKNIKIVTRDSAVTLRGVVENQSEHDVVLKISRNHADSSKITDEISVKNN